MTIRHLEEMTDTGAFEGAPRSARLIVWGTLMHRLVPTHLLGRVSSLDWLMSISLVPLSLR